MATFLAYANRHESRTVNGFNSAVVNAADAAEALAVLKGTKAPGVGDRELDGWALVQISATDATLPDSASITWVQGLPVAVAGASQSGLPFPRGR
jgi:hypothetical protein